MTDTRTEYGLFILLPDTLAEQIRAWVEPTPGASLPSWGAHITLLNAFVPVRDIVEVQDAIKRVCARFQPFTIRLDNAVSHTHLARPRLQAVFLTCDPGQQTYQELIRLHQELEQALAPLRKDLGKKHSPLVYNPHLSLTWGLPAVEGARLLEAAQQAQLVVEFTVDRMWLLSFSPNLSDPKKVERVEAFELGATSPLRSP